MDFHNVKRQRRLGCCLLLQLQSQLSIYSGKDVRTIYPENGKENQFLIATTKDATSHFVSSFSSRETINKSSSIYRSVKSSSICV